MPPTVTTLRPGLLISLKSTVRGNLSYARRDIEAHTDEDGSQHARWETERVILDPVEHEEAIKVRGQCRRLVTSVCSESSFGLLCPQSRFGELEQKIGEARTLADEFNAKAALSRIGVYVICGRVASDDVEAIRAINSELRSLLSEMETGLRELDVAVVRNAANKARGLGQMLTPAANQRMQEAIAIARRAARQIVKAGEQGAAEIDRQAILAMRSTRTAFLDLSTEAAEVITPEITGRALDLPLAGFAPPATPAPPIEDAAAPEQE
jgi:hypothetical protein